MFPISKDAIFSISGEQLLDWTIAASPDIGPGPVAATAAEVAGAPRTQAVPVAGPAFWAEARLTQ
eukprot:557164-Hanusia_phi.AAC.1